MEETDTQASLPKPGETVASKYVIDRIIGRGGMGSVVAAKHSQLGNLVAIKFLHDAALENEEAVERFLREARAAVDIQSEHVVKVHDVGTRESGAPYMVMEYLTGQDLQNFVEKSGPMGIEDAVDFLLQACEAIAEAHAMSIVHRDLKPANLFLMQRADGSPLIKVLDFGIAKALVARDDSIGLTSTGSALGTPIYMSPEQVRDAKDVDARTDVWGLGATLQELLTGLPPFEAETMPALCAMIIADEPTPLNRSRADAPSGLAAVIRRCLEKDRVNRFQTVAELARALEPFAPARSEVSIRRIGRIVDGRGPLVSLPEIGGIQDSLAETYASSPGLALSADPSATPLQGSASEPEAVGHANADTAFSQTSEALTGATSAARRGPIVGAVLALVAAVAILMWAAPWEPSAPPAAPASASGDRPTGSAASTAIATPPQPEATATRPSASSTATASASVSVSIPSPAPSARPTHTKTTTAPPPSTRTASPPPATTKGTQRDPLLDRK